MVSHGEFAPGLRSAVFMMTGPKDEVLCTNLRADMSADQFQDNFRELVAPIAADDEVILLCDILGGSPMTKSLEVLSERGMLDTAIVLTGSRRQRSAEEHNYQRSTECSRRVQAGCG